MFPYIAQVLPVVVYFSCCISVLYYVGAMQFIISKIAWVMQVTMGTAATESLIAAGNIFIGQVLYSVAHSDGMVDKQCQRTSYTNPFGRHLSIGPMLFKSIGPIIV